MKRPQVFLLFFLVIAGKELFAQDTLPKFSVLNVGNNRIIIGWVNTYSSIKQISIQRSFDSLTGYKTILTVADPTTPQNGYVDAKAVNDHMFYRLYIMLDKGIFLFSVPQKPVIDSSRKGVLPGMDKFPGMGPVDIPDVNKPKNNGFVPSLYIYTHRDGYVRISLPDNEKSKKYSIKFFEEDDTFLFELKEVKEKNFKIDRPNFYHAGWFRFELYEDGKLIEKHKFYLEKDF